MKKIGLIIAREYLSRVKKKSFIIMTFLGPILIGLMYGIAIWLAINADEMNTKKVVKVFDASNQFENTIRNSNTLEFDFTSEDIESVKKEVSTNENTYLLLIPEDAAEKKFQNVILYSNKQASISVISYIEKELESSLKDKKLIQNGISKEILKSLNLQVSLKTLRLTEQGEENSSAGASYGVGMLGSILIYLFIFLYGVQVMRGVIEEKNNRIVEVIISSVKPFQLMMGKIVGIAMVGLTQFVLWVALTAVISTAISSNIGSTSNAAQTAVMEKIGDEETQNMAAEANRGMDNAAVSEVLAAVNTINFPLLLGSFLFYFLAGYLLYSALFAAIGSAVDSEAETQQFMFPVTIPLIFSFVLASSAVVNNPDGPIAFWLSIIPLTSPVVMMVRIPFGVPAWQIALSMIMLILGFIATVWLAAKIYRTGILMYGKKVTFKEMLKWIKY